jgi:hypothetical protein
MAAADRPRADPISADRIQPTDWVAVFLQSYERSTVAQRVGPVSGFKAKDSSVAMGNERCEVQRLRQCERHRLRAPRPDPGRKRRGSTRFPRRRPRWPIGPVAGGRPWRPTQSELRPALIAQPPSSVLARTGFNHDLIERLQKQLAHELQTDPAATPVTQSTRLPGFFNHKRAQSVFLRPSVKPFRS